MQALDELASLPGCEIRISLDGRRTRLHAKAWLFQHRTGFGSAYVGSANLSGAALMGRLESTVKFTERGQPDLLERAKAHFETLWEDNLAAGVTLATYPQRLPRRLKPVDFSYARSAKTRPDRIAIGCSFNGLRNF